MILFNVLFLFLPFFVYVQCLLVYNVNKIELLREKNMGNAPNLAHQIFHTHIHLVSPVGQEFSHVLRAMSCLNTLGSHSLAIPKAIIQIIISSSLLFLHHNFCLCLVIIKLLQVHHVSLKRKPFHSLIRKAEKSVGHFLREKPLLWAAAQRNRITQTLFTKVLVMCVQMQ